MLTASFLLTARIGLLSAIAQDLKNLLSSQELSDVFLVAAGGKRIRAHKALLAARSARFKTLLADGSLSELTPDLPYELLLLLLEFLYTDQVRMSAEQAEQLAPFAKTYSLCHPWSGIGFMNFCACLASSWSA